MMKLVSVNEIVKADLKSVNDYTSNRILEHMELNIYNYSWQMISRRVHVVIRSMLEHGFG